MAIFALLFVLGGTVFAQDTGPSLPSSAGHARVELVSQVSSVEPGSTLLIAVRMEIERGWHVYGPGTADTGLPTSVDLGLPEGFSAGPLLWPPPSTFRFAGETSSGYEGELFLPVRIRVPASAALGSTATIHAGVRWLACRLECVPGKTEVSLSLPVSDKTPRAVERWARLFSGTEALEPSPRGGAVALPRSGAPMPFILAVVFAFLGGIVLNLMPCVLPVLSLKVMGFVRQAHASERAALAHGLSFAAGVVLSFWMLLGVLLALRAAGRLLGWGFQFQHPSIVAALAVFMFVLGLNLFGVFEIGTRASSVGSGLRGRGGLAGSFFTGFLATVTATPCSAPFMGGAVGYALAGSGPAGSSMPEAFAVFTALGLGMAAPSLLLSASPRLLARVPKAGRWTDTLKQVLGFPLMATAAWLAFVFAGLAGTRALGVLLGAFVAAGLGAWIYGRWGSLERSGASRAAAAVLAVALAAGGIAASGRAARDPRAPVADDGSRKASIETVHGPADPWQPFSEKRLAELRAQRRPVFLYFSAAWCLTCAVNERTTLGNAEVKRRFEELGVAVLKADWTRGDEEVTRALSGYGRGGVPLYVFYAPGADKPLILPEVLTPGIVLDAISGAVQ